LRRCRGFFDQQIGASTTQRNQDQLRGDDHARQEEARVGKKGGESGSYEEWTVDDLRKRVKELGLSGYSGKHKCELVSMLRNH
jgi:hypothetical protein